MLFTSLECSVARPWSLQNQEFKPMFLIRDNMGKLRTSCRYRSSPSHADSKTSGTTTLNFCNRPCCDQFAQFGAFADAPKLMHAFDFAVKNSSDRNPQCQGGLQNHVGQPRSKDVTVLRLERSVFAARNMAWYAGEIQCKNLRLKQHTFACTLQANMFALDYLDLTTDFRRVIRKTFMTFAAC